MDELLSLLKALAQLRQEVGSVGAVALIALGILAFFYRRDLLAKIHGLKDAHERRDRREERDIEAKEQIAGAIKGLGETLAHSELQRTRDYAELFRAMLRREP
jgi:hypothetical protein